MYPLLATSVEVEDKEETEHASIVAEETERASIVAEETEHTPAVAEETESTPAVTEKTEPMRTMSEKQMDDQILHLCIRVSFVGWSVTVVLSRGWGRGSSDAGVHLQQQVPHEE